MTALSPKKRFVATVAMFAVTTLAALFVPTALEFHRVSGVVADQQRELVAAHETVRQLSDETEELRGQLRAIRMLYMVEERTDAGDHVVSSDGMIEVFTRRDAGGHLCAHWCMRQDPGGPCLPSGIDRCLP